MGSKMPICFYLTPFDKNKNGRSNIYKIVGDFGAVYNSLKTRLYKETRIELLSAKDLIRSSSFWDKIRLEIGEAPCIIADLTGLNPNVLIEIGVALQANKILILISQDRIDKIPSNIRSLHVNRYENSDAGLHSLGYEVVKEIRSKPIIYDQNFQNSLKDLRLLPVLANSCFEAGKTNLFHCITRKIIAETVSSLGNGQGNEYDFFPDQYPSILSFLQDECKPVIKAISVVDGEEYFWPTSWGAEVLDTTNPGSTRVFVFQKPFQVNNMHSILLSHAERYNVRITTTEKVAYNPAKVALDCILFYQNPLRKRNIGAYNQKPVLVGFYKTIGLQKKVTFSIDTKRIDDYQHVFRSIETDSIQLSKIKANSPNSIAKMLFEKTEDVKS